MAEQVTNILIIGAGRGGTAMIKTFSSSSTVHIIGVVDADLNAPGIKLAKELKIPVAEKWDDFLKDDSLNEVINATGVDEVHDQLVQIKPKNVTLINGAVSHALWFFAKEYNTVEQKIKEAREDIDAHEWGVKKTNEAIKTLYVELEEKNSELQKLDRLKSDFISTVSHELRTPLAITKEGIALIHDGVLGHVNEKQAKVLKTSKESIDRLSRLIASLLDISKIEGGKNEFNKKLFSMNKVAQQIVTFFDEKASDKGLELKTKLPETDIDVYADHDRIIQIFTNLVANSIKFTDSGHIEIGVEEKEDEIECSVEDTGKGVSQKDISKMFDKFQQINREHGDGEQGTGLGLSIAKSIVDMHDGHIWAESKENKGTKVIFTLPKYADDILLKEYVDKGVKDAQKSESKMSLMIVTIDNVSKVKKSFSEEKIYTILKGIEGVLKNSLDQSEGATFKSLHECVIILPDSNKQSALSAEGRLKQAVDDYLMHEHLTDKIKLRFECSTYPDEATNSEELIKLAMKN